MKSLTNAAAVFAVALAVHGVDHARRGFDVVTAWVFWAGNLQIALSVVTLALIFTGRRAGVTMAMVVGGASAIGFLAAHLFPRWSAFSDSFVGSTPAPGVTGFSWFAALFEIAADATLAVVAWRAWRGYASVDNTLSTAMPPA